jgi:hypothetical protein
LSIFDGVVMLDDAEVPVIVGLSDGAIRMSSGGKEIGEWPDGEYVIDSQGNGAFMITAENETLEFRPARPDQFAAGVRIPITAPTPPPIHEPTVETATLPKSASTHEEGPAPKQVTRVAFLALAGTTAFLGLWALVRIVFG